MKMQWRNKIMLAMLVFNVLAIGLYYLIGDTKQFKISPQEFVYSLNDDSIIGGTSTSTMTIEGDKAILACDLKQSDYPWPYCEASILLSKQLDKGFDLSGYQRLYLDIDHQSEAETNRIRVYIRNYEPEIFDEKDDNTMKFNGIEFNPGFGFGDHNIDMAAFQVISWWVADYNIPIESAAPKFDNVPLIQVATGSESTLEHHKLVINSLIFEGAYIPRWIFYLSLVTLWIMTACGFLISELFIARSNHAKAAKRIEALKELNDDLSTKYTQIEDIALKDSLTGAGNRHSIKAWLDDMARKVRWNMESLSIIYLDIDHFKMVNDHFGHAVGDEVLREFVQTVHAQLRETDHLVRWGGEEFIIFCPGVTLNGAIEVAERVRLSVEQRDWPTTGQVTCSAGVAQMSDERTTETIARADEALYQAKQNGRNRIEVSHTVQQQVANG